MPQVTVRRIDFGYFVRPAAETGTGRPRVEPCLGYLVRHPGGVLLFDTGMGAHRDVDAHYRPRRTGLTEALAAPGAALSDVTVAANCHLHFDHCGGNPLLGQVPVITHAADQLALRARRDRHAGPLPGVPAWIEVIERFDPRLVYFAHDRSAWVP